MLLARLLAQEQLDLRDEIVSRRALLAVDAIHDLLHLRPDRQPGVDAGRVRITAGVERARLDTLDMTRALGSVALRGAQASRVGAGRDNAEWLSEVTNLALAALAADIGLEEAWSQIEAHTRDTERFARNLAHLLDGIEASLPPE